MQHSRQNISITLLIYIAKIAQHVLGRYAYSVTISSTSSNSASGIVSREFPWRYLREYLRINQTRGTLKFMKTLLHFFDIWFSASIIKRCRVRLNNSHIREVPATRNQRQPKCWLTRQYRRVKESVHSPRGAKVAIGTRLQYVIAINVATFWSNSACLWFRNAFSQMLGENLEAERAHGTVSRVLPWPQLSMAISMKVLSKTVSSRVVVYTSNMLHRILAPFVWLTNLSGNGSRSYSR